MRCSLTFFHIFLLSIFKMYDILWSLNLTVYEWYFSVHFNRVLRRLRSHGTSNEGVIVVPYCAFVSNYRGTSRFKRHIQHKGPPPENITLVKGPLHIAVTRSFTEFIFGEKGQNFLDWIYGMRISDEEYFQSLNHSPKYGVPGAYRGNFFQCVS